MRRVLSNLVYLARGRGVAAVMLLGSTTLMARALGPTEFGLVVLMHAYVLLIRGLVDFQSFEAVVRYGVPMHDTGDIKGLSRLMQICQRVDRRVGLVSTLLALILAPLIGPLLGMDHGHVVLMTIYSLILLSSGNGSANGTLRLFDQFDALGRQMIIAPAMRFVGITFAWWLDGSMPTFVAILGLAFVAENLYLSWRGKLEFRKRIDNALGDKLTGKASMAEFSGLRRFLWVTYWQSNMDLVPKHVSTMLAGYLLGPAAAGLFRLARELSSPLTKPAFLIRQVVFLDLTRSAHQDNASFNVIAYRTALIGAGFGLLFVMVSYFLGERFLSAVIGSEFVAAAPVLTLLLLAATFEIISSSLRSAAYALDRAGRVLRLYVISVITYLTLFIALTSKIGLLGAGLAACISAAFPPLAMAVLLHNARLKKSH